MNKNHYKNKIKVGDYVINCDTCAMKCWASESHRLVKETGKGGAIVCPNCNDKVHYGFVPYKILPEDSIPVARVNLTDTTQLTPTIDINTRNPFTGE
jgi:DNA-directed RNA polymerase subunit RPC12/RpoP